MQSAQQMTIEDGTVTETMGKASGAPSPAPGWHWRPSATVHHIPRSATGSRESQPWNTKCSKCIQSAMLHQPQQPRLSHDTLSNLLNTRISREQTPAQVSPYNAASKILYTSSLPSFLKFPISPKRTAWLAMRSS